MANLQGGLGGAASGAASGAAIGSVVPGIGTAIGAIGGGLIGGLTGLFSSDGSDEREQQMQLLQQMQAEIDAIPLPSVEAQQLVLDKYRQTGLLTPEMEASITQGPSRMEQVKTDPRLREAQMGALAKLQQVGEEGLTPTDKVALNTISRQVGAQEQARQQSILQGMQQRGVAGSGAELAAQLSSSQAAAERQAQESQNVAAQAQQRALQAIMQRGTMGSQMEQQQFGEQEAIAKSADQIAAANAQAARNLQQRNVEARNAAQQFNLANQQRIAEANVGLANKQQQYNKELLRQQYLDRLAKVQAKSGNIGQQSSALGQAAERSAQAGASLMSGLGQVGAGLVERYGSKKTSNNSTPADEVV